MQLTHVGLPNSCSNCAKPVPLADGWFAEHDDAALSGAGVCAACYGNETRVSEVPTAQTDIETNPDAVRAPLQEAKVKPRVAPTAKRAKKAKAK